MTAAALIKQEDVKRIMAGARAAGFTRVRMTLDQKGNLVVDASDEPMLTTSGSDNPLDRLLPGR